MLKTAKLLLLMMLLFVFGFQAQVNSSSLVITNEDRLLTYEKFETNREIDRRLAVEKQLLDSLIAKSSVKWVLTGFTEDQLFYESSGDQTAISPRGARGIAQFMPSTWQTLIDMSLLPVWFDINNETHQRIAQLVYLDYLYNMWNTSIEERKALTAASYNAGLNRVKHIVQTHGCEWKSYLPKETIDYLAKLNKYI